METLRRRLRVGIRGKGKTNVKKARRDLLATHLWKEEATRIKEGEEEERQKGEDEQKKTEAGTTKPDQRNKTEQEEMRTERKTWETVQVSKSAWNKTLEEMGFNGETESSSRGERMSKREQYQKSCEEYEYPKKRNRQDPKN